MISFGPQVRVFVATQPIDFRIGVHGLVALVAQGLQADPYKCGDVFVFRSKRADRLKLLAFDGTGMVLATKWLEDGKFAWPPIQSGALRLTATQLAMLFDGLGEWLRLAPPPPKRSPQFA
jgi:transposase